MMDNYVITSEPYLSVAEEKGAAAAAAKVAK
jgi:hypothetical protein